MTDGPAEPSQLSSGERYPIWTHVAALTPLALFIVFCYAWFGNETDLARRFYEIRAALPGPTRVVGWLTSFGNIPFYLGYVAILYGSIRRSDSRGIRFVVNYLLLLFLLILAADTLKIWIGRPRPGVPGDFLPLALDKRHHSFPSNHVLETLFTVVSLLLYCRNRALTLVGGIWLATMAFTRIFLGRHHPSDFLGSMAVGSLWVWLMWRFGVRDENSET